MTKYVFKKIFSLEMDVEFLKQDFAPPSLPLVVRNFMQGENLEDKVSSLMKIPSLSEVAIY